MKARQRACKITRIRFVSDGMLESRESCVLTPDGAQQDEQRRSRLRMTSSCAQGLQLLEAFWNRLANPRTSRAGGTFTTLWRHIHIHTNACSATNNCDRAMGNASDKSRLAQSGISALTKYPIVTSSTCTTVLPSQSENISRPCQTSLCSAARQACYWRVRCPSRHRARRDRSECCVGGAQDRDGREVGR